MLECQIRYLVNFYEEHLTTKQRSQIGSKVKFVNNKPRIYEVGQTIFCLPAGNANVRRHAHVIEPENGDARSVSLRAIEHAIGGL